MTIRNQARMTSSKFADLVMADSQEARDGASGDAPGPVFGSFTSHSSGLRKYTPAVLAAAIRQVHPTLRLTMTKAMTCDLVAFAAAGLAKATLSGNRNDTITERVFAAPKRRFDETGGDFRDDIIFASYDYEFEGSEFLVYVSDCRDGENMRFKMNFILSEDERGQENEGKKGVDDLIEAATRWGLALHEEVLVFDQGAWMKDKELWKSIQKSNWDDVILEDEKKNSLIKDIDGFFKGEANYKEFAVPWKRGLIFYGPPGNGKTISIKALMHSLSKMTDPTVEMLYVKSFKSFQGPEYGIRQIFTKARSIAPCLLIFEDIDSLVTDAVRSYFLNEVDGLESNHGVLMVGSTNHIEKLDPGISKRPSRFDRKYLFALPTRDERVQYCEYWRNKLKHNKDIEFPTALSGMIADITDEFSFAYIKEAFVASLLAIVVRKEGKSLGEDDDDDGKDEAEKSILWKEIKKQVKILRDELSNAVKEYEGKTLTTGLDVSSTRVTRVIRAE